MVDVRDSENPVVLSAGRWLAGVNARHPWSHNEHFHSWILRHLPARRQVAVDVGCGAGLLTGKLAPHFGDVSGWMPMGAWLPRRVHAWPAIRG